MTKVFANCCSFPNPAQTNIIINLKFVPGYLNNVKPVFSAFTSLMLNVSVYCFVLVTRYRAEGNCRVVDLSLWIHMSHPVHISHLSHCSYENIDYGSFKDKKNMFCHFWLISAFTIDYEEPICHCIKGPNNSVSNGKHYCYCLGNPI